MVADDVSFVEDAPLAPASASSYRIDILKSVLSQQSADIGWHAVTESALSALAEVLDRYLKGMAKRIAAYAELGGRSVATVDDFRLALRDKDASVSLKDLSSFCSNLKESSLVNDIIFPVKVPSDLDKHAALWTEAEHQSPLEPGENGISLEGSASRSSRPEWMDEDLIFPPIRMPIVDGSVVDSSLVKTSVDTKSVAPDVEIIIADIDEEVPVIEPPLGSISVVPTIGNSNGETTRLPRQLSCLAIVDGNVLERQPAKDWSHRLTMELKLPKLPVLPKSSPSPKKSKTKDAKSSAASLPQTKPKLPPFAFHEAVVPAVQDNLISAKDKKASRPKKIKERTIESPASPVPTDTQVRVKVERSPERSRPIASPPVVQEPLLIKFKPPKMSDFPPEDSEERKEKAARKEERRLKKEREKERELAAMEVERLPKSSSSKSGKLDTAVEQLHAKKRKAAEIEDPHFVRFEDLPLSESREPDRKKSKSEKKKTKDDDDHFDRKRIESLSALINVPSKYPSSSSGKSKSSHESGQSRESHSHHDGSSGHSRSSQSDRGMAKIKMEKTFQPEAAPVKPFLDFSTPVSKHHTPPPSHPPIPKLTLKFGGKDLGVTKVSTTAHNQPLPSMPATFLQCHSQPPFADRKSRKSIQPDYGDALSNQYGSTAAPLDLSVSSRASSGHGASGSYLKAPKVQEATHQSSSAKSRSRPHEEEKPATKKLKKHKSPSLPPREPTPPPPPVFVPEPEPVSGTTAKPDGPPPIEWFCPYCHFNDEAGEMVACDRCDFWYHLKCVGMLVPPPEAAKWFCSSCTDIMAAEKAKKNKKRRR